MLALYRSGRQGEALGALERARRDSPRTSGSTLARCWRNFSKASCARTLTWPPARLASLCQRPLPRQVPDAELGPDDSLVMPGPPRRRAPVDDQAQPLPRQPGRRSFLRRRSTRTGLIAVVIVVLVAVLVPDPRNGPADGASPQPGLELPRRPDRRAGRDLPDPVSSAIKYADGIFWDSEGVRDQPLGLLRRHRRTHAPDPPGSLPRRSTTWAAARSTATTCGSPAAPSPSWSAWTPGPDASRTASPLLPERAPLQGDFIRRRTTRRGGRFGLGWPPGEVMQVDPQRGKVVQRFPLPYEWGMAFREGKVWVTTKDGLTWIEPRTGRSGRPPPSPRRSISWSETGSPGPRQARDHVQGLDGQVMATCRTDEAGVGDSRLTSTKERSGRETRPRARSRPSTP